MTSHWVLRALLVILAMNLITAGGEGDGGDGGNGGSGTSGGEAGDGGEGESDGDSTTPAPDEPQPQAAGIGRPRLCTPNPCQNGGLCELTLFNPWFNCICAPGYRGQYCQGVVNPPPPTQPPPPPPTGPCSSGPCGQHGKCTALSNGYYCTCDPGYSGGHCDTYNPCSSNPCPPLGTCQTGGPNGYMCVCPQGHSGPNCKADDPCDPNPCHNGGQCQQVSAGSAYVCNCVGSYYGVHCDDHPCQPNPCQNGGQCSPDGQDYDCHCLSGYSGQNCQNHPCQPNPCQNGGQCSPDGQDYDCHCLSGYYGQNCQNQVNPCQPNPCNNGGICSPRGAGYECECDDQYWYGPRCNMPIDCADCLYDNGRGYLENELYCHQYIICVMYPGGIYRVYHMECAPGTSWSQELLTCVKDEDCNPGYVAPITTPGVPLPCYFDPYPGNSYKYIWHYDGEDHVQDCPPGTMYSDQHCVCVHDNRINQGQDICLILDDLVTSSFNYAANMPDWASVFKKLPDVFESTVFNGAYYYSIHHFNNWLDEYAGNQIRGIQLYLKMHSAYTQYQGVLSNADCDYKSSIQLVIRNGVLYGGVDTTSGPLQETPGLSLSAGIWHYVRFGYNQALNQLILRVDNGAPATRPNVQGYIENRQCAITLGRIVDDSGAHYFTGEIENVGFYKC